MSDTIGQKQRSALCCTRVGIVTLSNIQRSLGHLLSLIHFGAQHLAPAPCRTAKMHSAPHGAHAEGAVLAIPAQHVELSNELAARRAESVTSTALAACVMNGTIVPTSALSGVPNGAPAAMAGPTHGRRASHCTLGYTASTLAHRRFYA